MKKVVLSLSIVLGLIFINSIAFSENKLEKSKGENVYVPISYTDMSYLKDGNFIDQHSISVVVIRNIDPNNPITVTKLEIYDTYGNYIDNYVDSLNQNPINPMASISFSVNKWDLPDIGMPPRIDVGTPSIVIEWKADKEVNKPLIITTDTIVRAYGPYQFEPLCLYTFKSKDISKSNASKGQTLYVPFWANNYGNFFINGSPAVRNTDPKNSIRITSIKLYDPDGNEVQDFGIRAC